MVRCAVASRSHIFTGGEDGKLCAWMKSSIEDGGRVITAPSMSTAVLQHSNDTMEEEEVVEGEEVPSFKMVMENIEIEQEEEEDEESEEGDYRDSNRRKRIRRNDII